jgi:hypothetical protein
VYADFHRSDDKGRLPLDTPGTRADLARLGIELKDGLELLLYEDDADAYGRLDPLLAEGIVRFDSEKQRWVAEIDRNAIQSESEIRGADRKLR